MSISVQGLIGKFLVDTGASRSVISRNFLSRFRPGVSMKITDVRLESVTGEPVKIDSELGLTIDGGRQQKFLVLPGIRGDGILGAIFLGGKGQPLTLTNKYCH